MSDVDAIVLDIDGGDMLRDCVVSLLGQTMRPRKVIVFDNGSRTAVSRRIEAPVTIVRSDVNLGFAAGVNAALAQSDAPFVALVNNDVVLDADWVETVRAAFDVNPRLGAAQAIVRRDEATLDGAGIDISDGTFRQAGHGAHIGDLPRETWGVSATAAMYRRAAVGSRMFDERFFAYYEDVELCARLKGEGWATEVLPVVKATHRGSQSASVLGSRAVYLRTRNRYFTARMHRGVGRIPALLAEDVKLFLKHRSSARGVVEGLFARL